MTTKSMLQKKNLIPAAYLSILTLIGQGCAVTSDIEDMPLSEPGAKSTLPAQSHQDVNQKSDQTQGPSKKELLGFVLRLTDDTAPLSEADSVFLKTLPKENISKFAEAALVVGLVRQASVDPSLSISKELGAYKINLAEAMKSNVALKNFKIYRQVLEALNASSDEESYKSDIRQLIVKEATDWSALLASAGQAPKDGVLEQELSSDAEDTNFSPGDLVAGDSLLESAQAMAEQRNYKKAIEIISEIADTDPLFESAVEYKKKYSNLAVQELRQKAAEAYQNAMPAQDLVTKTNYLDQARVHLESAIHDFPEAEQIQTVRQNLAVITKDIEKIKVKAGIQGTPAETEAN